MSEKKEKKNSVLVGKVEYHNDHTKNKEVFKSLFGKKPNWEALYERVVAAKKKL